MLKLLHTSDWHLGKKLFKKERSQEHQMFLDWLLDTIKEQSIDVLLIAGDIFDSPTPPNSALKMYYDFLAAVAKFECLVYLISGNHDSAGLLESTDAILHEKNINVSTKLHEDYSKHCVQILNKDKTESIRLKTLPYFRSHEILQWTSTYYDLSKLGFEERIKAISATLKKFLDFWPPDLVDGPCILMSHHLFGNFLEAGSEQSLSLSGLDSIPVELLKEFDYVALGHIHKTQYIRKNPPVLYPGSPLPMRFSESNNKSISIIKVQSQEITHELISIPVFKPLIQARCHSDNIKNCIDELKEQHKDHCYLELLIDMDGPMAGTIDQVRSLLEHSSIELLSYIPQYEQQTSQDSIRSSEVHNYGMEELFEKYYKIKFPENKISKRLHEDFITLLNDINQESNENS